MYAVLLRARVKVENNLLGRTSRKVGFLLLPVVQDDCGIEYDAVFICAGSSSVPMAIFPFGFALCSPGMGSGMVAGVRSSGTVTETCDWPLKSGCETDEK